MTQTSSRVAVQSVLGTVTTAANAISSLFNTTGTGINMLNEYVTNAARHQRIANAARESGFEARLAAEIAREDTMVQHEIEEWCNTNTRLGELYKSNLTRIQEAIDQAKA